MAKRRQSAELPLFDLPLQSGEPPPAGEAPPAVETSPAGGREEQLELVELEEGEEPGSVEPETEGEGPYERALLGDRLLGGLADLAVQLVTSGLALAAVQAMGVAVTWSDLMPFAVLALVFSFLYWMIPLAFWGHTPGMAWVGHTALAAGGEPLTFSQTFRRWLGALFTLALAGLPLLLAWTGRSFSDRLSDSKTVAEP